MKKSAGITQLCFLITILSCSFLIFSDEEVSNPDNTNKFKYPETFDLKAPLKKFDERYSQLYSKYKEYYQRWDSFNLERDIEDPPEIDYYLKLEKNGKLPSHVRIYHNDTEDLYSYGIILKKQKIYNNYKNIKLVVKTNLEAISKYDEILDWATIDGNAARMPNIPYFDLCLWVQKKYEGTDHLNNNPEGLIISCNTIYYLGKELFPQETRYMKKFVFPYFKSLIDSGFYHPGIFKILYLFERKEVYIRKACELGKHHPVYFSTWGDDYESYKRKIRIAENIPELEPFVINLLNNGKINETTQYDSLVYLYNLGTIKNHLNIIFRILDNEWFGYSRSPAKYLDLLLKIKDARIKSYFKKNLNREVFSKYKEELHNYIVEFDKTEEN